MTLPHRLAEHQKTGHRLSPRELEVTLLLGRGLRATTIAERLGLSKFTVYNALKAAYKKVGVHSQAKLAEWLDGPRVGDPRDEILREARTVIAACLHHFKNHAVVRGAAEAHLQPTIDRIDAVIRRAP